MLNLPSIHTGILFNNFMDKWEGKVSEVSASMVPTLMHLFFNTISKYKTIDRMSNHQDIVLNKKGNAPPPVSLKVQFEKQIVLQV